MSGPNRSAVRLRRRDPELRLRPAQPGRVPSRCPRRSRRLSRRKRRAARLASRRRRRRDDEGCARGPGGGGFPERGREWLRATARAPAGARLQGPAVTAVRPPGRDNRGPGRRDDGLRRALQRLHALLPRVAAGAATQRRGIASTALDARGHQARAAARSRAAGRRQPVSELPAGGESAGRRRLSAWIRSGLEHYGERHDDLAADATSRLSPYLHLGCLSPLEVAERAARREAASRSCVSSPGGTSSTTCSRPGRRRPTPTCEAGATAGATTGARWLRGRRAEPDTRSSTPACASSSGRATCTIARASSSGRS